MSAEVKQDHGLQIAHILFTDIVGYSKLLSDEQRKLFGLLNEIVRNTSQFRAAEAAGKLVRLSTGDGIALAFFTTVDVPVRCALEIGRKLREHPELKLRMGINSGPVDQVSDVNDQRNITGVGVNVAQRVMDCGDAGHILLSRRVADDLAQYHEWKPYLHDLGRVEVKHGVKLEVVNLYNQEAGNSKLPGKLKSAARKRRTKKWMLAAAAVLIAAMSFVVLRISLRARSGGSSLSVSEKSIAVLPFENLSAEKENAFFADGVQDDVLTSLAKIAALKVISRTSVMQYRGAGAARNLREIAQALGVANILEGTVRRVGNRALINVQLIDARNDRPIWSERYDRTIADSIGLQGELATEIAAALKAKLAPEEKARLATKPTTNPEAYLAYLRALERGRTGASKEDAFATDELYAKAIELDPEFALAIARRSMWNGVMYNVARRPEHKATALTLAARALQLAPDLPEAHVALGLCFYFLESNYPAALKEFSIAASASALEPDVIEYTGLIYCRQGRWREGIASYDRAQELDPRQPHPWGARARAMVRDWPGAVAAFQRLLKVEPNNVFTISELATVKINQTGDVAAARELLDSIPPGLHGAAPGQPSGPDEVLTVARWELNMLARDYTAAAKALADYKDEEFEEPEVGVKSFDAGQTALARGDEESAKSLFEKVRPIYETGARAHPDDARFHAPLGLLYAYLGRKDDAIRESLRAVELVPESKDAQGGAAYADNLALVYARTGEIDQALALIQRLLTTPNGIMFAQLHLSWEWDPMRSDPRFQEILAGPEPKTIYN
jgi:TolB-like protein